MSPTDVIEPRIPVEVLKSTPLWGALTAKQAFWIQSYLESGYDARFATRAAFDSSSERNSKILTYEVLRNPKVRAVLDEHFCRTPREAFLETLQKQIEHGTLSIAEIEGIKILCTLRGWDSPEGLPSRNGYVSVSDRPNKYAVGGIYEYQGKQYRITKLDRDGDPCEGDPVEQSEQ